MHYSSNSDIHTEFYKANGRSLAGVNHTVFHDPKQKTLTLDPTELSGVHCFVSGKNGKQISESSEAHSTRVKVKTTGQFRENSNFTSVKNFFLNLEKTI